jgi:hypothetical protein
MLRIKSSKITQSAHWTSENTDFVKQKEKELIPKIISILDPYMKSKGYHYTRLRYITSINDNKGNTCIFHLVPFRWPTVQEDPFLAIDTNGTVEIHYNLDPKKLADSILQEINNWEGANLY